MATDEEITRAWAKREINSNYIATASNVFRPVFDLGEAKRVSEEAKALLEESRRKVAEADVILSVVTSSNRSVSSITHAEVKRYACRQALRMSDGNNGPMFDMKSAWGKEMARRVKTYLSFHKGEIAAMVELHQARAKRNRHAAYLEGKWKSNILSNSLYVAYKEALSRKDLRHLRVRYRMLSVCTGKDRIRDCRNMMATSQTDLKVLSILRNRRVDRVDEKWY